MEVGFEKYLPRRSCRGRKSARLVDKGARGRNVQVWDVKCEEDVHVGITEEDVGVSRQHTHGKRRKTSYHVCLVLPVLLVVVVEIYFAVRQRRHRSEWPRPHSYSGRLGNEMVGNGERGTY